MSRVTYFIQECPTCGRGLEVKVEYLGRRLTCQHCRGAFIAQDPSNPLISPVDQEAPLLRRVEALLRMTAD